MKKSLLVAAATASILAITLSACSSGGDSPATPSSTASHTTVTSAVFGPWVAGTVATSYSSDVPVGSKVNVSLGQRPGHSDTTIWLRGLLPDHVYGAYLHLNACGAKPGDAGGRYQNSQDPKQPSTDSRYTNAKNEVWLQLKTDGAGDASANSAVKWQLRAHQGKSIIISNGSTRASDANADAGSAALACVNLRSS